MCQNTEKLKKSLNLGIVNDLSRKSDVKDEKPETSVVYFNQRLGTAHLNAD